MGLSPFGMSFGSYVFVSNMFKFVGNMFGFVGWVWVCWR